MISKPGHIDHQSLQTHGLETIEAGHPTPDQRSLAAGARLLEFLEGLPDDRPLLFLISGGASSLVEVLRPGVGPVELEQVNEWLLANGISITDMNQVRRSLSLIKGGGLLRYIGHRPVELLLISDVPKDDPAVIGSGLLVPPVDGLDPPLPRTTSSMDQIVGSGCGGEHLRPGIQCHYPYCRKPARGAGGRPPSRRGSWGMR